MEKAFCNCIAPTISFPAHALPNAEMFYYFTMTGRCILTATHGRCARAGLSGVCVSKSPLVTHRSLTMPAYARPLTSPRLAWIQVDDNCQAQPTLLGTDSGDVANISLISLWYGKIPIQQVIRSR
jgi:hypothetical protein